MILRKNLKYFLLINNFLLIGRIEILGKTDKQRERDIEKNYKQRKLDAQNISYRDIATFQPSSWKVPDKQSSLTNFERRFQPYLSDRR